MHVSLLLILLLCCSIVFHLHNKFKNKIIKNVKRQQQSMEPCTGLFWAKVLCRYTGAMPKEFVLHEFFLNEFLLPQYPPAAFHGNGRAGWIEIMQPYLQNIRDPRGGDEIAPSTRSSPWRLDWKGPETDGGAVMARKGADRQSRGSEEPQFSSLRIYPERHRRTKRWPVRLKQRVRSSRRLEPGNRFEFHSVGNGEPLKNIKRVMGWFLCFIEMTLATVQ